MSSDEENFAFDDDDDDDVYMAPAHHAAAQAAAAAAPAPIHQQQQQPAGAGFNPFGGMFGHGGPGGALGNAFGGLFGGAGAGAHHGMNPAAGSFRMSYRAYSTAILEIQRGRADGTVYGASGRDNVNFGGKIIMPPSALQMLTELDIESPWTFELVKPTDQSLRTHCGVLEFIADEGTVNLPAWVMKRLKLNEGDPIRINGARLPKGKFVKLQPQHVNFLELSDPKAVLEQALRNFACLSVGDIIEIAHNSINFEFLIMEAQPNPEGINVIDTDLEVDFAPPVGYVEPTPQPRAPPPTMASKLGIKVGSTQAVDASGSGASTPTTADGAAGAATGFAAFVGQGNSLSGKRVKGKGTKTKKIEDVEEGSLIRRTNMPRVVTNDTQLGERHVPAALNLPFGHLFFGYTVVPVPGSAAALAAAAAAPDATPAPFGGATGTTLSGRVRSDATLAAPDRAPSVPPSSPPAAAAAKPAAQQSFAGAGNTLSGRRPPDVIEIDD